jgi:seryl-tRNA synthetase
MIDINRIRNNKEEVEKALLKRMDNVNLDEVLEWDKEKRKIGTLMDEYRAERRKVSDTIPTLKKEGKDTAEIVNQMKELGNKIDEGMVKYNELDTKIFDYLAGLPNTPDEDVPAGGKENNVVLNTYLDKPLDMLKQQMPLLINPLFKRVSRTASPRPSISIASREQK